MKFISRNGEDLLIRSVYDITVVPSAWCNQSDAFINMTYTIALTPRQYLSHMDRNLGWPPRSQLKQKVKIKNIGMHAQEDTSYHFNVTWPRWTRFMLNPTVGIELWTQHGLENEHWFTDAIMRWTYSIVNSPPWKCKISDGKDGHNQSALTARTLKSDVFPAFWRPIMVISISVALSAERQRSIVIWACCLIGKSKGEPWLMEEIRWRYGGIRVREKLTKIIAKASHRWFWRCLPSLSRIL